MPVERFFTTKTTTMHKMPQKTIFNLTPYLRLPLNKKSDSDGFYEFTEVFFSPFFLFNEVLSIHHERW
jgi:hypothetical protein